MTHTPNLKVAIAGLGAVCLPVAKWLDQGVPGFDLVAVSAGNKARAAEKIKDFKNPPPIVDLDELVSMGDIIVEGLPPERYFDLAVPAIEQGKILIAVTITQLLERIELIERAKQTGARIIVPTGALMAFDAVRAASYGTIHSLVMLTRKPPKGLIKAPFVIEQGIDLSDLKEPLCLYKGTVRDAAAKFPANVNVAVALSLAGPGPDHTSYEIWADPAVDRNTHTVKLDSDSTRFEFTIAGVPTEENPATGKLTPLSVMTTLEGLVSTLRIGA
jgi:aspartate dehydrogenase